MKQYMRDKPVKMWIAAHSVSAYCHNFDVYVDKSNTCECDVWLSVEGGCRPDPTSSEEGSRDIHRQLLHSALQIADYLHTQDTYLCGTIHTNRKGYPKRLVHCSA